MGNLLSGFNSVELFFLICAVIGGVFVLLRIIMLFIGLDHDMATDMDAGHSDFDLHHSDSDIGFKIFSLQSITSFLMMFGLVGLALYRQSKTGLFVAMVGAIVAGLFSIWIIGKLFSLFIKLQASGTITMDDTIGAVGKVYLNIPANGTGRVLVKVKNSLREFDAASNNDREIPTDTSVRVVWVDGNILVVEQI